MKTKMAAGTWFLGAAPSALCAMAALIIGGPAGRAEIIYVSNTSGNTIEMFDARTGADLGTFASSGLNAPTGLAFDVAGNLYVANSGDNTIRVFTTNGIGSVFASTGLSSPQGLAFDGAGNLYVGNSGSDNIVEFTPSGVGSLFATNVGTSGPYRYALAFDGAGNLYASSVSKIEKFTPDGTGSVFVNSASARGLAFDRAGNLYAACWGSIVKYSPAGVGSNLGIALSAAVGVALDSAGNLYASCIGNNTIEKFAPDGTDLGVFASGLSGPTFMVSRAEGGPVIAVCSSNITVTATVASGATVFYTSSTRGGCGAASVSCSPPSGSAFPIGTSTVSCVATDSCGQTSTCAFTVTVLKGPSIETIYVSDTSRNTIEMYELSTGAYLGVFARNGLTAPTGLAFDSVGNLYVANSGNNTVEMFTTNGVGSVFANTTLNSPQGLAPAPFDQPAVYAANGGDGTIAALWAGGAGLYATNVWPIGLAFDATGKLYASDGYEIWQVVMLAGYTVKYYFADCPGSRGLAFDSAGNLYAARTVNTNSTIMKFTLPWGFSSVFATNGLSDPWGLAFDSVGRLYVANHGNGTIRRFAPNGTDLGVFASGLSGPEFIAIRAGSPPLVVGCPSNVTVRADGLNGTIVSYTSSAGSGCGGASVTCSPPSGSLFPIGATTVSCVATDSCGQTANCAFTVTVVKPPLVAVCSPNITFPATDSNGAQVSYTSSPSGGCSGASITCNPASGSTFPIGTTTVSCVATDACGQTASCAFTVTVVKPPLAAVCPTNILVAATGPSGATVFYTSSTSGGCSGASITCNPPSGSFFPIGTTTVSCLATDACGQTASCAFSVMVKALGSGGTVTDCTEAALRTAMLGGGVVTFACDGTIRLSSPLSVLTDTVLDGNSHKVTIGGNSAVRLVYVSTNVRLTILNLSFADGVSPNGGALFNAGGSVYATNCVFTGNHATGADGSSSVRDGVTGAGGAVYNAGSFIASQCAFVLNGAQGGRGADGSPDVLPQPPPAGNGGWGEGGAFCNLGVATFERSLFASNSATGGSGGRGSPGDLSSYPQNPMSYATRGGRGGAGAGGGLYNLNAVSLVNCTLAYNKGNGGNGGVGGYQISNGSQPMVRTLGR